MTREMAEAVRTEARTKHLIEVFADLVGAYGTTACEQALAYVITHDVLPPVIEHRCGSTAGVERDMQRWLDTPPGPLR